MKRVTISVSISVDLAFRTLASQKFNFEKGWYSMAINEAMTLWINQNSIQIKDPKKITPIFELLTD